MQKTFERTIILLNAIKDKETDPEEIKDLEKFISDKFNSFSRYNSIVVNFEMQVTLWKTFYEPEQYLDKIERLDKSRRLAHVAATVSINQLNRLCKTYNVPEIFDIKNEQLDVMSNADRETAAEIIFEYCKEMSIDQNEKGAYNENRNILDEMIDKAKSEAEKNNTKQENAKTDFCL